MTGDAAPNTSLTGRTALSDEECDLLNLSVRYGGLGLSNPTSLSAFQYQSSAKLTAPLVDLVLSGSNSIPGNLFDKHIQKI